MATNDGSLKKTIVDALNNDTVVNVSQDASTQTASVFAPGTNSGTTTTTIAKDYTNTDLTKLIDVNQNTTTWDIAATNSANCRYISKPIFNLAHNKHTKEIAIMVHESILGTICFIHGDHWSVKEPEERFVLDGDNLAFYKIGKEEILAHFHKKTVNIAIGNQFTPKEIKTLIALLVQNETDLVHLIVPKKQYGKYGERVEVLKRNITNLLGVQVNEN